MRNVTGMDRRTQSEERAARNEVSFRKANEKLGDKRQELELPGRTPFLCECSDPDCTELIHLSLEQYDHIRSRANWFVTATGHDGLDGSRAEEHGAYVIIQKDGEAGRIAEEENPR
jgi:hypothetical protein